MVMMGVLFLEAAASALMTTLTAGPSCVLLQAMYRDESTFLSTEVTYTPRTTPHIVSRTSMHRRRCSRGQRRRLISVWSVGAQEERSRRRRKSPSTVRLPLLHCRWCLRSRCKAHICKACYLALSNSLVQHALVVSCRKMIVNLRCKQPREGFGILADGSKAKGTVGRWV
jgi:hypothetical protein